MENLNQLYQKLEKRNPGEIEFLQAVKEVFESIEQPLEKHYEWKRLGIVERLTEPQRQIIFSVPWVDDQGQVQVNRGYRVEFNNSLGPFKGGLRFHPTVNLSIIKFLAFEQTFKNALTGLPIGGGKGGSDFNPKGKSDGEIMRFCQSFMTELYRHLGPTTDVPAGDIGVSSKEIGFLFGMYKKLTNRWDGALTGKGLGFGGSLLRKEATGYGLCYFMNEYLQDNNESFKNKKVIISGSGNVALYAAKKAIEFGATVIAMSDSNGVIYHDLGLDLDTLIEIKEVKNERVQDYLKYKEATYLEGSESIWQIKCDLALPCATQNELTLKDAKALVKNGCIAVGEGANMPTMSDAVDYLIAQKVLFAPAKAANAGGVATSVLEMSQNSAHIFWKSDEVDGKIKEIMRNIYGNVSQTAKDYGKEGNLVFGANVAGFIKVASAMESLGVI
jgi:glutamate dehydrogenase (NADP+)